MKSIGQLIVDDPELCRLLMNVLKWRNPNKTRVYPVNDAVCELADKIFEKYNIDLEIYT